MNVEKGGRGPWMHKCLQRVQKVKLFTSLPIKSIILSMKSIIFSIIISIIYVNALRLLAGKIVEK